MNDRVRDELDSMPSTARSGTVSRVLRLTRKELSETLRDRRTIMTLLLMPLLLYPLLSIAFQQFLVSQAPASGADNPDAIRMGFQSDADKEQFIKDLGTLKDLPRDQQASLPKLPVSWGEVNPDMDVLKDKLYRREIDVIVISVAPAQSGSRASRTWDLYYLEDSFRSKKVLYQLGELLAYVSADIFFKKSNVPPPLASNLQVLAHPKGLAAPKQRDEFPLGSLVPLILILMTITGAVYPAIDLTAGERERGTLEILVAAPVPRLGLLFAKYITVVTVALLTAVVNLLSMTLTVWVSGLSHLLFGAVGLTPLLVLEILGLLVLFAGFFSAALLTLASFARSFKEAQAYLIPLMLMSLAPGVAGMIPGVQLSFLLALVPLLNVVLLGRDLLAGTADPLTAVVVVASTMIYAVAAIALAARIFGSEDVLYSNQSGWSELFRRPLLPRPAASVSSALLCVCLIFSLYFIIQGVVRQLWPPNPGQPETILPHLILVPVLSVLLFAGLPLAVALARRIRPASGFLLRPAPLLALVAALFLGLSLWPLVLEILAVFQINGWTTISPARQQEILGPMRQIQQSLPLWLLLVVMVVPALAEELFFRGFLFAALQRVCDARTTILASALLFGLFHVALGEFGLERMLPSTLMGLVLGVVCWRSGSVVPGMLLHACHNAVLVWIGRQQAQQSTGEAMEAMAVDHLPWLWLAVGSAGALIGAALLLLARRPSAPSPPLGPVPLPERIHGEAS